MGHVNIEGFTVSEFLKLPSISLWYVSCTATDNCWVDE